MRNSPTCGPYSRTRILSISLLHSGTILWFLFLLGGFNLQLSIACNRWCGSQRIGRRQGGDSNDNEQRKTHPWKSIRAGATAGTLSSSAAIIAANSPPSFYYGRVALAGGLAGATGTMVLYPMDCAKTLRQSNPTQFSSVRAALWHLIRFSPSPSAAAASSTSAVAATSASSGGWHIGRAYRGWLPAAIGAVPSSALYFGAYEASKQILLNRFGGETTGEHESSSKWWIHGLAAATGNTISSAIFVPKEVLKQQMQYATTTTTRTISSSMTSASLNSFPQVFWNILQEKGIAGFYVGYQATLMRNIPSAMIRFVLYEELKKQWSETTTTCISFDARGEEEISTYVPTLFYRLRQKVPTPVGLFAAGAVAGAAASGIMTPVDVIKTRLATGTCPVGVQNCFQHILAEMGWRGLYVGAGSRMLWSGAFSAIGFGTFEVVKGILGVDQQKPRPRHYQHHQENLKIAW